MTVRAERGFAMTDRYQQFATSSPGQFLVRRLGLPNPVRLRRYRPGDPVTSGPVLVGGAGRLIAPLSKVVEAVDGIPRTEPAERHAALVFDASGITDSSRLSALYDFFHPVARTLHTNGRVVVLGTPPEECGNARERVAQRALEGFVRSVGKEFGRATTANLVYV